MNIGSLLLPPPPPRSKTKTSPSQPQSFFCQITSKNPTKYCWSFTPNLKMCIIFCCCEDLIYSIQIMKRCNINCTKLYNTVFIFKLTPKSAVNHVFYLIYLLTIYMYILHEHVFFFKSFFFVYLYLMWLFYMESHFCFIEFLQVCWVALFLARHLYCLVYWPLVNHGFSNYSCI